LLETVVSTLAVGGVSDEALSAALREHGLALKVPEVRSIAERLGRDPTLVECYGFDAQWSEHCSYKSSRAYLRQLPTEGPTVMQGPQ
jgi:phosphoribosylformylglycinamidine synthase